MQKNKNGIQVQEPKRKRKRKRKPLDFELGKRKFASIVDGVEVVAVVPNFSPIIDVLIENGWKKVY